MAVVISHDAEEEEKFGRYGLDIKKHRDKIDIPDEDGRNVEDFFKNPDHPLRLVFVCSMWLTGFDAPSVSTLYLDKPMQNHTLMQTIARANRVYEGKKNGIVVDYYGVFRNLKKALARYADGSMILEEGNTNGTNLPVQNFDQLLDILNQAISEIKGFLLTININIQTIFDNEELFSKISLFDEFAEIILTPSKDKGDENKKQFTAMVNAVTALYDSCKPEIYNFPTVRHEVEVLEYLKKSVERKRKSTDLETAKKKISDLLDTSVLSTGNLANMPNGIFSIKSYKEIDLAKLDFEKLRQQFKISPFKHLTVTDLQLFIEQKLKELLQNNKSRINFLEKFQGIVDQYNTGSIEVEKAHDEMTSFLKELSSEEKRHIRENLTEEELEIFDLLHKNKLTKAEEQQVKLAAKELLVRLKNERNDFLILDWYKDQQTRAIVKAEIEKVLDELLPRSYDPETYKEKCTIVYQYLYDIAERGRHWA
jgi:type I restriction enzyme R subunit